MARPHKSGGFKVRDKKMNKYGKNKSEDMTRMFLLPVETGKDTKMAVKRGGTSDM